MPGLPLYNCKKHMAGLCQDEVTSHVNSTLHWGDESGSVTMMNKLTTVCVQTITYACDMSHGLACMMLSGESNREPLSCLRTWSIKCVRLATFWQTDDKNRVDVFALVTSPTTQKTRHGFPVGDQSLECAASICDNIFRLAITDHIITHHYLKIWHNAVLRYVWTTMY